jgi:uncharacterized RDD family membrane protein YckC
MAIWTLKDSNRSVARRLSWRAPRGVSAPRSWYALPVDSGFDVFVHYGSEVRWRHLETNDDFGDPRTWERVAEHDGWWAAARIQGESVAVLSRRGAWNGSLSLEHRTPAGWTQLQNIPVRTWASLSALSLAGGSLEIVLSESQAVKTLEVDGGGVRGLHDHPQAIPMPFDAQSLIVLSAVLLIPSAVAAVVLTVLMRRDRIDTLTTPAGTAHFASLSQRAAAYGVDCAWRWPMGLPWIWPYIRQAQPLPMTVEGALVPVMGSMAAWLGAVALASYSEGRWGFTPGKWVVGIRLLGDDLAVCGFKRALLRNALTIVDGMLAFAPALAIIALGANWQRAGDIAAKTVVVRKS